MSNKQLKLDQPMLSISDFNRGKLSACEDLAEYFFNLSARGQLFIKTEQVGNIIRSVKLTLEKEFDKDV